MMTIANEATPLGQAAHADSQYKTSATGLAVQDDYDARVLAADATHTARTNAELSTALNTTTTVHPWGSVKTYAGGDIVSYGGEGTRTEVEEIVATAIAADALFATGPHPTTNPVNGDGSAYLDPLYLIEASKLTGEKFY